MENIHIDQRWSPLSDHRHAKGFAEGIVEIL